MSVAAAAVAHNKIIKSGMRAVTRFNLLHYYTYQFWKMQLVASLRCYCFDFQCIIPHQHTYFSREIFTCTHASLHTHITIFLLFI